MILSPPVREQIALIDVVQLAADLIRIPSCSQTPYYENGVADYLFNLLKSEGIPTKRIEALPGRYNVVSTLKGTGEGRSLMLCGHMDTVPAYDMQDPLSGLVKDGILYGRGACDMKGPLAAMLAAFIGIKRSGVNLQGDLVFASVIDEEETGKGVEALAEHGPFVNAAVIGEPTQLRLAVGHKGLEWVKIEVIGKKVHGGRMHEGINAIAMASRLIERIYGDYVHVLDAREHPILGKPTINIGKIEGGDQPSTVAGTCVLSIDRRRVPAESLQQVYDELQEIINVLHEEDEKFNAKISSYFPSDTLMAHDPFCTDEHDPLVAAAASAMLEADIQNIQPTFFPAWTDAGILAAFTPAKCIVIGPGDLALAHTASESIETAELIKAAHIYGALAHNYLH